VATTLLVRKVEGSKPADIVADQNLHAAVLYIHAVEKSLCPELFIFISIPLFLPVIGKHSLFRIIISLYLY